MAMKVSDDGSVGLPCSFQAWCAFLLILDFSEIAGDQVFLRFVGCFRLVVLFAASIRIPSIRLMTVSTGSLTVSRRSLRLHSVSSLYCSRSVVETVGRTGWLS